MQAARAFGKGSVWSALFLVLLAAVSGMAVMVVAGKPSYAVFFLPAAVLAGLGLLKWEGS
jgi:amino acid transporter